MEAERLPSAENRKSLLSERIGQLAVLYAEQMAEFGVPLEHSGDTLTSGWLCVIYFLGFLEHYPSAKLDEIFPRVSSYVAMYLLVDHFVDSPDVSKAQKISLLQWLGSAGKDTIPAELEQICEKLLFHLNILGGDHIPELVRMVQESYKAQVSPSLSTSAYLRECRRKGALTSVLGTRIIFGELFTAEEHLERLGYCAQLLDDITDCSSDLAAGVHTACTHRVRKDGNLDRIVWELLWELTLLPNELKKYAIGLRWMTVYVAGRTQYTSRGLRATLGLLPEKVAKICMRAKMESVLRIGYRNISCKS